jgi:ribonuclease HI
VAGVFRTTNIAAIESLLSIPPLYSRLMSLNHQYASRLSSLSPHHPILARLDPRWLRSPSPFPTLSNIKSPLRRLSSLGDPDAPSEFKQYLCPWEEPLGKMPDVSTEFGTRSFEKHKLKADIARMTKLQKEIDEIDIDRIADTRKGIVCFTDGSLINRRAGAAFVVHRRPVNEFFRTTPTWTGNSPEFLLPMGTKANSYDAEVAALVQAAAYIANLVLSDTVNVPGKDLWFCFDNQGAVKILLSGVPKTLRHWHRAFRLHIKFLLARGYKIMFKWIPSHIGINGNERVDVLAKEAASLPSTLSSTVTFRDIARKADTIVRWTQANSAAKIRRAKKNPSPSKIAWIWSSPDLAISKFIKWSKSSREVMSRYFQVVTGHCHSSDYYQRFLPKALAAGDVSDQCKLCGRDNSVKHILFECPAHADQRSLLLSVEDPSTSLEVIHANWKNRRALELFLQNSSAFTRDQNLFIHAKDKTPTQSTLIGKTPYLLSEEYRPPKVPPPEPPP